MRTLGGPEHATSQAGARETGYESRGGAYDVA